MAAPPRTTSGKVALRAVDVRRELRDMEPNTVAVHKPRSSVQYAVRGPILQQAVRLQAEIKRNPSKYAFSEIVHANIGNPQQLGQPAVSYYRQLLSCVLDSRCAADESIPADIRSRAAAFRAGIGSGGAYTPSNGAKVLREEVAAGLTLRDGFPVDPESIFLTDGASSAVKAVLELAISDRSVGIIIPVPEYPLYTATVTRFGGTPLHVFLNEESGWALRADDVAETLREARNRGILPRVLVVINPGNPTGALMCRSDMEALIRLCSREGLLLIADEVYQENVYADPSTEDGGSVFETGIIGSILTTARVGGNAIHNGGGEKSKGVGPGGCIEEINRNADSPARTTEGHSSCTPPRSFISFRRVMKEMGVEIELISLHSASKGFYGECGLRGGMMQLENVDSHVIELFLKQASVSLCANTAGQTLIAAVCNPPCAGSLSYPQFSKERAAILGSLRRKLEIANTAFAAAEGISCQRAVAAMYIYPRIELPQAAVAAAEALRIEPDFLWCSEFLNATGVITVPGSGFGQRPGSFHFRLCVLPSEEKLKMLVGQVIQFQRTFRQKYGEGPPADQRFRILTTPIKAEKPLAADEDSAGRTVASESDDPHPLGPHSC